MSFVRSVHAEKLWGPIVAAAMVLASGAIAFLVLSKSSAPVSATPPAAEPSYQAADEPVPPGPAVAERTPVAEAPREPAAPSQDRDEPTADQMAASEQSVFKTRRALETVDPRELLRQGAAAQMLK